MVDWAMLVLAVASVALLVWIAFGNTSAETERRVIVADYVICGVFAVEFLWRWRRSRELWLFPVRNWYDVLGMVPVSNAAVRSFRLLRLLVVLSRMRRVADLALGDRVAGALVSRWVDTIVDVVRRPVTVAMLDEVAAVLETGQYTRNIAAALEQNRAELDQMIVDLVKQDARIGRLRFLPFHDDVVRLVSDTVFRLLLEVLDDPRTDELISDVLRENLEQIGLAVRGRDSA
jgi:hypothetical protein